jgi:hypothetical protein
MNFQQVQEFLTNFDIVADETNIRIPKHKYQTILQTAARWYGAALAIYLSDCFLDTPDAHYLFLPVSWEEMRFYFEGSTVPKLTHTRHPTIFQKGR